MRVIRESTPHVLHVLRKNTMRHGLRGILNGNTLCGWPTNNFNDAWVPDEFADSVSCKACLRSLRAAKKDHAWDLEHLCMGCGEFKHKCTCGEAE